MRVNMVRVWSGFGADRASWQRIERRLYSGLKRVLDVVLSVLVMPLCVVAGLLLWLVNPWLNPGPLLFCQMRIGHNGAPFTIYKFRSLAAGRRSNEISAFQCWLRRLRIDELPQFINVLQGNMSVVGPRPEVPEFVALYARRLPCYMRRFEVMPGITGHAQLEHGYAGTLDQTKAKLDADLRYVADCSLRFDLAILMGTAARVLSGRLPSAH